MKAKINKPRKHLIVIIILLLKQLFEKLFLEGIQLNFKNCKEKKPNNAKFTLMSKTICRS